MLGKPAVDENFSEILTGIQLTHIQAMYRLYRPALCRSKGLMPIYQNRFLVEPCQPCVIGGLENDRYR